MNKKRLNITLPESVAEAIAPFGNKSKFIAEAVKEKIMREEKKKLDCLLIEGYKNESASDNELDKEWEDATLESWPD